MTSIRADHAPYAAAHDDSSNTELSFRVRDNDDDGTLDEMKLGLAAWRAFDPVAADTHLNRVCTEGSWLSPEVCRTPAQNYLTRVVEGAQRGEIAHIERAYRNARVAEMEDGPRTTFERLVSDALVSTVEAWGEQQSGRRVGAAFIEARELASELGPEPREAASIALDQLIAENPDRVLGRPDQFAAPLTSYLDTGEWLLPAHDPAERQRQTESQLEAHLKLFDELQTEEQRDRYIRAFGEEMHVWVSNRVRDGLTGTTHEMAAAQEALLRVNGWAEGRVAYGPGALLAGELADMIQDDDLFAIQDRLNTHTIAASNRELVDAVEGLGSNVRSLAATVEAMARTQRTSDARLEALASTVDQMLEALVPAE